MLISSRRFAAPARHSGRNRLALAVSAVLEQAGGMLLSPVVIVAVCSLLTTDLTDMVLPAVVATAAWIVGYAAVPILLSRARRRLPWTIGAAIVRTASLALLAYVLAGDDVSREQRLESILICVGAYALATGLARGTSESLVARVTSARRSGRTDVILSPLPVVLTLLVGIGSFTLLIDVPRSPLPRLSVLFGVAACLSGASILFLGRIVEAPNLVVASSRSNKAFTGWRRQTGSIAWLAVTAASSAAELLLVVGLVRYVDLPRAYLLSGIGVFLAASAVAAVAAGAIERTIPFRALIQVSAVLSGIAFTLAVGLPTLLETERSPDVLIGRQPAEVGVWVVMALVGVAQQTRRRVLPWLADHTSSSPALLNAVGLALAFLPLALAVLFDRWEPRDWLLLGLGAALFGIAVGGAISPRRVAVRAQRPTALPMRPAHAMRSAGGRSSP